MAERGDRLRLALEPLTRRVVGKLVRQNLDGHFAIQPRVARLVHLAHAAGAQGRYAPSGFRQGGSCVVERLYRREGRGLSAFRGQPLSEREIEHASGPVGLGGALIEQEKLLNYQTNRQGIRYKDDRSTS